MEKPKCIKCGKEATVIEHDKYFCSRHGWKYVQSHTYKIQDKNINKERGHFYGDVDKSYR